MRSDRVNYVCCGGTTNGPPNTVRHRVKVRPRQRLADRRGVAAVELAVCLPLLTLLIFGSIQACEALYLRHSVVTAAYEASLELSRPDATDAAVSARIDQVLAVRGVKSATHSIAFAGGSSISDATPGAQAVVTVTAPIGGNLALMGFFPLPGSVTAQLTCTR